MKTRVALSLAIGLLVLPKAASAWCRTTADTSFVASPDQPCDDDGRPVFWATRCVDLVVNELASSQVDFESAKSAVLDAFATWSSAQCPSDPVSCTGQIVGTPSISVSVVGSTACGAGFERAGDNANVVVFHDAGWPHEDPESTLALTTVTFRTDDGRILDGDIEINSDPKLFHYTAGDPDPTEYDLRSVLTHEAGHFLGLAHTQPQNIDATMAPRYVAGSTFMRTLTPDDVCGVCAAAAPDRDAACMPSAPGECEPGAAAPLKTDAGGCAYGGRSLGASGFAALAALVALARLRRRAS